MNYVLTIRSIQKTSPIYFTKLGVREHRSARLDEQKENQQPKMIKIENVDANATPAVIVPQINVHLQPPQFERRLV